MPDSVGNFGLGGNMGGPNAGGNMANGKMGE